MKYLAHPSYCVVHVCFAYKLYVTLGNPLVVHKLQCKPELFMKIDIVKQSTVRVDHSLPYRKWKEIKQQPGTAGPGNMLGCCLIYFHFRWGKLSTLTVVLEISLAQNFDNDVILSW